MQPIMGRDQVVKCSVAVNTRCQASSCAPVCNVTLPFRIMPTSIWKGLSQNQHLCSAKPYQHVICICLQSRKLLQHRVNCTADAFALRQMAWSYYCSIAVLPATKHDCQLTTVADRHCRLAADSSEAMKLQDHAPDAHRCVSADSASAS